ncbi:O-antigen polysaccharide polymerase Wzy [Haloimpatiens sp. FM7315]|uniref:O-antigen polysaccharide polymerase Wzy n=1 Tax=Haloimpatiens sp. FM7315 TaxID=3298609 RepID=UPI00370C7527
MSSRCYKKNSIQNIRLLNLSMPCILLAISFVICFLINNSNAMLNQKVAYSMGFVSLVYAYLIFSTYKETGIAHFYFVFLVISIVFYYGQHIAVILNYEYIHSQSYSIIDGIVTSDNIVNASFLIIQCLLLLHVGYVIGLQFNLKYKLDDSYNNVNNITSNSLINKSFVYTAWIFFVISVVPMLIMLLRQINLTETYGYLQRRTMESSETYYIDIGINKYVMYLSQWFLPSLYMLLISYSKKNKHRWVYLIIIAFCSLYLMTGSRYILLKVGLVIFLIQFIWIKPLNRRTTIKLLLIGLSAIVVLKAITYFRADTSAGISDLLSIISKLLDDNLICGTLWETGITFTSISNMIQKCPSVVPYFYGKSYIGSILCILPEFLRFGFFDKYTLTISSTFSPLYYNTNLFGYGSSFIAEAYYNFGYFVLPVMVLFGYAIARLENKLVKAKINCNAGLFLVLVYIFAELLYGIRNDLYSIPRTIVLYVGIPLLFAKLLNIIMRKKS